MVFFILFQSSTLASFGLDFDGVLILFAVYMLHMMVLTLLSQVIYSATNGRPGRKRVARILAVALFAPLLVAFALRLFSTGSFAQTLLDGDGLLVVLQILMWMQVFMVGTGRGLLELYTHYLYMAPASPFQKAVWSNMELVVRTAIESVLFLGIPNLIIGSSFLVILGSMAVYILFTLLLLGVNYLSMRWTEANLSQGMLIVLYFFAVALLMLPGLAGALIAGFSIGGLIGILLALLILSVWELIVALACFALSKDVLHNCDMANMKT